MRVLVLGRLTLVSIRNVVVLWFAHKYHVVLQATKSINNVGPRTNIWIISFRESNCWFTCRRPHFKLEPRCVFQHNCDLSDPISTRTGVEIKTPFITWHKIPNMNKNLFEFPVPYIVVHIELRVNACDLQQAAGSNKFILLINRCDHWVDICPA